MPIYPILVSVVNHEEIMGRTMGLLIGFGDRLTTRTQEIVHEMVDAGESGLALETTAEMLAEGDQPVADGEREEFLELVSLMSMDDRVERNLALCPPMD